MSRMFLTTKELALITGVSRASIFEAMRTGALQSVKLAGRRRRVRVCDAEAWLGAPLNLPTVQS
jgi:excisionase family DNA binding protein